MHPTPKAMHESWHPHIGDLFNDQKMLLIKNKILPNTKFFPEVENIFRVFSMPLEKIKVVILGQDPYSKGEATGLAFAVKETTPIPASLRVIGGEIHKEPNTAIHHPHILPLDPKWRTLEHWVEQGVF